MSALEINGEAQQPEEQLQISPDGDFAGIPEEKSDVYVDPDAPKTQRRFEKHDQVHMTVRQHDGSMQRGIFFVAKVQFNARRAFWEYQLKLRDSSSEPLYDGGKWFRERDLRMERRAPRP